jgi:hypothetical protein
MVIQVRVSIIRRVSDLIDTGTEMIFYLWSGIRTRLELGRIFFSPAGNPTGTRYFITGIILGCE